MNLRVSGDRDGIEGLYPVCKPPGMTSHDVVATVRRLSGIRHTGHAGTLDPAAAGVLLVLVGAGPARLAEYLLDLDKTYLAEIRFGRVTDTQDYTGRTVALAPDSAVAGLSRGDLEATLARFVGEIEQVPPMVSAVRVGGRRLHDLAREGLTVRREPRPVTIYELRVLDYAAPVARVRVVCSSGTYVRTLAHDIGQALGVGAIMGFLVREAVGPFRLKVALTLEELAAAAGSGRLVAMAIPPAEAVGHLPAVRLTAPEADRVRRGESVPWVGQPEASGSEATRTAERYPRTIRTGMEVVRVLSGTGELVAIASLGAGRLQPKKVLKPQIGGSRT